MILRLVILYFVTLYFSMHKNSYLMNMETYLRIKLNQFLAMLMSVEQVIVLLFLSYGMAIGLCGIIL
jgi:hypothetical protein